MSLKLPMGKMLRFFIIAAATFLATPAAADIVLRLACGSSDRELTTCISNADAWVRQKDTAVRVKTIAVPDYTDDRHTRYKNKYYPCSSGTTTCSDDDHIIDLYSIDVIWPSSDYNNFINLDPPDSALDKDVGNSLAARFKGCHLPNPDCKYDMSIIENNTVYNRLVAIPAFADGGMLYSRIDLIQKHHQSLQQYVNGRVKRASHSRCVERIATDLPKRGYPSSDVIIDKLENFLHFVSDWNWDHWNWTWDDLTSVAKYIQELERCEGNAQVWGLIWQGKTAQQLISSALEWIGSKQPFTGHARFQCPEPNDILDRSWTLKYCPHDNSSPDWQDTVIEGIKMAHNWIWHDEIAPLTVLSYGNKESEAMFDSGNVVFMRHWPSTWAVLMKNSKLDKKIAVTYLPRSNRENPYRLSTLGGWELAVSKKSKHQSEAVDLALFLTNDDQQKRNAITGVLRPTIKELIDHPVEIQREIGEYNRMFDDPKRAHVISALRPAKRSDLDWCKSPAPAGSSGADEPVAGQRTAAQAKPEPEAGVCFNDYDEWSECFYAVVHDMLSDREGVSRDKLLRMEKSEKCKCGAK